MVDINIAYAEWGSINRRSLRETLQCVAAAGGRVNGVVVVDNKGECAPYRGQYAEKTRVLAGDNSAREFSAWDLGVEALGGPTSAAVLLCANDTFAAHRRVRMTRRWRVARWLEAIAKSTQPEMFGQVDPFGDEPVHWAFGTLSTYISSYLFGLNAVAASVLFPLTAIDRDTDALLENAFSPKGLFSDTLSLAYRRRIEAWLFEPEQWRNAAPLSAENFAFFRLKAKSIIYEHALTCRAQAAGVLISDMNDGRGLVDKAVGRLIKAWQEQTSRMLQMVRTCLEIWPRNQAGSHAVHQCQSCIMASDTPKPRLIASPADKQQTGHT